MAHCRGVKIGYAKAIEGYGVTGKTQKRCKHCGKSFIRPHPRQEICSLRCQRERHRAQIIHYRKTHDDARRYRSIKGLTKKRNQIQTPADGVLCLAEVILGGSRG